MRFMPKGASSSVNSGTLAVHLIKVKFTPSLMKLEISHLVSFYFSQNLLLGLITKKPIAYSFIPFTVLILLKKIYTLHSRVFKFIAFLYS